MDLEYPLHVTTMHSEIAPKDLNPINTKHVEKIKCLDKLGDSLAIVLTNNNINKVYNYWTNKGCQHSYSSLVPHITIQSKYDISNEKLHKCNKILSKLKIYIYMQRHNISKLES